MAELLADYLSDLAAAVIEEMRLPELSGDEPLPPQTLPPQTLPPKPATTSVSAPKIRTPQVITPQKDAPQTNVPQTVTRQTTVPQTPHAEQALPILSAADPEEELIMSKLKALLAQCRSDSDAEEKREILRQMSGLVARCRRCPELVAERSKTVFGDGNPAAELVFVGEGPGADEDRQGLPFVGRSGQLLTDIITKGMKLRREDVYICNIVRCRPPGNRTPSPLESAACRDFLDATLQVIAPKFICCLGATAATRLLDTTEPIGRLRSRVLDYNGAKVVCTYHPAYLLRNPPAKAQTWEDIKLLMRIMQER